MGISVLLSFHSQVGWGLASLHVSSSIWPLCCLSSGPCSPAYPWSQHVLAAPLGAGQRLLPCFAEGETEAHRKVSALPISLSRSAVAPCSCFPCPAQSSPLGLPLSSRTCFQSMCVLATLKSLSCSFCFLLYFFLPSFGRLINGGVLCCLSLCLERAM